MGNFVVKIFLGGQEQQIIKNIRTSFTQVKTFKPKACRQSSVETYLIGVGFKGS